MRLRKPITIEIGRLGRQHFSPALYLYAGSACGPGGLNARLQRHLRTDKPAHWHIDYLRPHVEVLAVYYVTMPQRLECAWSQALRLLPDATTPVAHFGSTDCAAGCPAHLIALPLEAALEQIGSVLAGPEGINIQTWFASRATSYRRTPPAAPDRESA
jgi:Uri superfamily endonuclease